MSRIYKITPRPAWEAAERAGVFEGAPVDIADGYIHFSTAAQAGETARKYFSGQDDLLLIGFETDDLGPALRWEPSRGGDLFPHLYEPLRTGLAVSRHALTLDGDGTPVMPDGLA